MRVVLIIVASLFMVACSNNAKEYYVSEDSVRHSSYRPIENNGVYHVAGFDVDKGQQMRDFFDDFEEPMHTNYSGNTVEWTYYIDYNAKEDEGKIVRYCDLADYKPHSLCAMKVSFYKTYVSNAVSNCR